MIYMLMFWGKGNDSGRYIYCYFYCLRLVHPMAMGLLIYNFIQTNKLYSRAMFTLYRIAFAPPRKSYRIERLFTHKNCFGGAISVTEQKCATPICKVESQISKRCVHTISDSFCAATKIISDGASVRT